MTDGRYQFVLQAADLPLLRHIPRRHDGEVAAEAAEFELPEILPFRQDQVDRLFGQDLPRLDTPSKMDGRPPQIDSRREINTFLEDQC